MMVASEFGAELPDPNSGFDAIPAEQYGSSYLPSDLHLYRKEMDVLLASHTGSPDVFLTAERERELATIVQTGRQAQIMQEEDEGQYHANQSEFDRQILKGTSAQHELVESNLRFAASMARASMNILPRSKSSTEDDTENTSTDASEQGSRMRIRTFGDITDLRSRYADLSTRIQVANIGLMKAAADYQPDNGKGGESARFTTYAAWKIHGELARYVKTNETPGWYVPVHIAEAITKARQDPAQMTDQLRGWDAGRYTVPLDSVSIPATTIEDEEEPTEILGIADLVQDDAENVVQEALEYSSTEVVKEALKKLAEMDEVFGERNAAVVAMRFGISDDPELHGQPHTLDEISSAFGITRERVRQIEIGMLSKLRKIIDKQSIHLLREGFSQYSGGRYLPALAEYTGNIRTGRAAAYGGRDVQGPTFKIKIPNLNTYRKTTAGSYASSTPTPAIFTPDQQTLSERPPEIPKESWQTHADEPFDLREAMGLDDEERAISYEAVASEFRDYLFYVAPELLQQYIAQTTPPEYPVKLVEIINRQLGKQLTAEHIESFWNDHLETFVYSLAEEPDSRSLDAVTTLFSKLLAERMTDDSLIELQVPETLNGRLNYIGAWINNGRLEVHGDVGDFVGYKVGGLSSVTVHGMAGDFAGVKASGYCELKIDGNAGHFFGGQAYGSSSLIATGSVGDFCGEGMDGNEAAIFVGHDCGDELASDARAGSITVLGNVGSVAETKAKIVTLLLPGGSVRSIRDQQDHNFGII